MCVCVRTHLPRLVENIGPIRHRVEVRLVEADPEHASNFDGTVADESGDDVVRLDL